MASTGPSAPPAMPTDEKTATASPGFAAADARANPRPAGCKAADPSPPRRRASQSQGTDGAMLRPATNVALTPRPIAPIQRRPSRSARSPKNGCGSEVLIATDTADINATGYGTAGATGHVYRHDLATGTTGATVVVQGGAGSVAADATQLYTSSSSAGWRKTLQRSQG